jgi:hypothetical protein
MTASSLQKCANTQLVITAAIRASHQKQTGKTHQLCAQVVENEYAQARSVHVYCRDGNAVTNNSENRIIIAKQLHTATPDFTLETVITKVINMNGLQIDDRMGQRKCGVAVSFALPLRCSRHQERAH